MNRYIAYFKYVIRHKWYVFIWGLKIGAPIINLIIHDWSKFLPDEFLAYAKTFYDDGGHTQYISDPDFANAWRKHIIRNPHHYQHWCLLWDNGDLEPLEMPQKYVKEMVSDWCGAAMALRGNPDPRQWFYKKLKEDTIKLHPQTVALVGALILYHFGKHEEII